MCVLGSDKADIGASCCVKFLAAFSCPSTFSQLAWVEISGCLFSHGGVAKIRKKSVFFFCISTLRPLIRQRKIVLREKSQCVGGLFYAQTLRILQSQVFRAFTGFVSGIKSSVFLLSYANSYLFLLAEDVCTCLSGFNSGFCTPCVFVVAFLLPMLVLMGLWFVWDVF